MYKTNFKWVKVKNCNSAVQGLKRCTCKSIFTHFNYTEPNVWVLDISTVSQLWANSLWLLGIHILYLISMFRVKVCRSANKGREASRCELSCKAERQCMLTCKLSRYCLLALHGSEGSTTKSVKRS